MTYAEYQQLRALAQQMIAAEMAKLMPAGARGVIVSQGFVSLQAEEPAPPEPEPETWELWLWAKIHQHTSHGDVDLDWQRVATVYRGSPLQAANSLDLQLFDFPAVEGNPADRHEYRVQFEARRHEAGSPLERERGTFLFPVLVIFHEVQPVIIGGNEIRVLIQIHKAVIRSRSSNTQHFTPQAGGVVSYINVASILRAN